MKTPNPYETGEINTVAELRKAIKDKRTKDVYVQPRFGLSEIYLRITKTEALIMLAGYDADATAEDCEVYAGSFDTDGLGTGSIYL